MCCGTEDQEASTAREWNKSSDATMKFAMLNITNGNTTENSVSVICVDSYNIQQQENYFKWCLLLGIS
jgi:hypothetical protein